MPTVRIDYSEVQVGASVGTIDTDDTPWSDDVFVIPVCIPLSAAGEWLAAYDPSSSTSPAAATGRIIARAVLDALKRAAEAPDG